MLFFLYGTDTAKARAKAHELTQTLQKKKPNASFFKINGENCTEGGLLELIGSQGLFEHKYIVFADGLLGDKEKKDTTLSLLKEIQQSDNVFIFLEGECTKEILKKVEKYAEKVQEFSLKEEKPKKEFKIFALSDAIGARDRKGAWVIFEKGKRAGIEAEQMHGIIFWQIKSLILAREAVNASQAGLNPYVFSKAKAYAARFKEGELARLSGTLVSLYHDARRGKHDLETALERFILTI